MRTRIVAGLLAPTLPQVLVMLGVLRAARQPIGMDPVMRAYGHKRTLLIVLIGSLVLLAPVATGAASSRVYVANNSCQGHSVRPSQIILACGDGEVWATNLRFSHYGGPTAWSSGTLQHVVCQPSCAQGYVKSDAARIKLDRIVSCAGRRYYGRATVVSPARLSHHPWYISPFGC
jgi:hypothetical protein